MTEKLFTTPNGIIHYWMNEHKVEQPTLVLLPGLTADHRLFDKQIEAFQDAYNLLVWDAPAHAASRPFTLTFSLEDKARWLHEILEKEHISHPILIGQSMGGYVSQMYMQLYPNSVEKFISIDSAPLQRKYMANWEMWALKHTEMMYRWYPWKALLRDGARGCAETEYGQQLMREMMCSYSHEEYAKLAAHGYRMLANAVEADLPYTIDCPALLLCGEKDKAGSAKRYNQEWTKHTGIPLVWIPNAGHNSNTDQAEFVNQEIGKFIL